MGQASVEELRCGCGAGVIKVDVTILRVGVLAFRAAKPSPCTACGSVEIPAADKERLRRLQEHDS